MQLKKGFRPELQIPSVKTISKSHHTPVGKGILFSLTPAIFPAHRQTRRKKNRTSQMLERMEYFFVISEQGFLYFTTPLPHFFFPLNMSKGNLSRCHTNSRTRAYYSPEPEFYRFQQMTLSLLLALGPAPAAAAAVGT